MLNPRLAPELERTILRALAKSPDERFHTAAEMASELRAVPTAAAAPAARGRADAPTQRIVTVPRHNPVNAYTMGGIARDAGLSVEQFRELL